MSKSGVIGRKPTKVADDPDSWVENRGEKVKPKRLTIDMSPELHYAFKELCLARRINMRDMVQKMVQRELGVK